MFLCSLQVCAPSTDPSDYHLCPNLHLNGGALIWSERGTGTAGASHLSPSSPTMSICSIRKEVVFSHADITGEPFLGCTPSIVLRLSSSFGQGVSANLFLEMCAVSACSPRAAWAPTSMRGRSQTQSESAVVKEDEWDDTPLCSLTSISFLCTGSYAAELLFKLWQHHVN